VNQRDPATGQWSSSDPSFQITATGAEANGANHRVTLTGNINTAGAVQIQKDGVKMQGHPLCIAHYDPVDGRSIRRVVSVSSTCVKGGIGLLHGRLASMAVFVFELEEVGEGLGQQRLVAVTVVSSSFVVFSCRRASALIFLASFH
jgi:hypothetical protein